jgi:outer membrane protein assembly factor BamD
LADYPDYKKGVELQYMLEVVTGLLARHELYVARFYLNRDEFRAAVARTEYALANYPDSGLNPEAKVLLGETYLKMREFDRARAVFEAVEKHHPESAFSLVAKNFLAHITDQGLSGSFPTPDPDQAPTRLEAERQPAQEAAPTEPPPGPTSVPVAPLPEPEPPAVAAPPPEAPPANAPPAKAPPAKSEPPVPASPEVTE